MNTLVTNDQRDRLINALQKGQSTHGEVYDLIGASKQSPLRSYVLFLVAVLAAFIVGGVVGAYLKFAPLDNAVHFPFGESFAIRFNSATGIMLVLVGILTLAFVKDYIYWRYAKAAVDDLNQITRNNTHQVQ